MTHYKAEGANGTNVGSRMYLLEDESNYKMCNPLNNTNLGVHCHAHHLAHTACFLAIAGSTC